MGTISFFPDPKINFIVSGIMYLFACFKYIFVFSHRFIQCYAGKARNFVQELKSIHNDIFFSRTLYGSQLISVKKSTHNSFQKKSRLQKSTIRILTIFEFLVHTPV